jgi:hypothetical protein
MPTGKNLVSLTFNLIFEILGKRITYSSRFNNGITYTRRLIELEIGNMTEWHRPDGVR